MLKVSLSVVNSYTNGSLIYFFCVLLVMKLWDLEEIIEGSNGNASGGESDSDNEEMDLDNDPKPSRATFWNILKHFFLEISKGTNQHSIHLISELLIVCFVQVPRGKQKVNQLLWTLKLVSSQTVSYSSYFLFRQFC